MSKSYSTQNDLLLNNVLDFYQDTDYLKQMLQIINGESSISLRIVDWFTTNYAKKYYTLYNIDWQIMKVGVLKCILITN